MSLQALLAQIDANAKDADLNFEGCIKRTLWLLSIEEVVTAVTQTLQSISTSSAVTALTWVGKMREANAQTTFVRVAATIGNEMAFDLNSTNTLLEAIDRILDQPMENVIRKVEYVVLQGMEKLESSLSRLETASKTSYSVQKALRVKPPLRDAQPTEPEPTGPPSKKCWLWA